MSDFVRIMCPNLKCRTLLSVPGSARGKSVRCRACGTRVRVPDVAPMAAPAAARAQSGAADAQADTDDTAEA